jgi:hypothetical protein
VNLKFSSAAAFAQSVRQRLDNLPNGVAVAIVEGASDKQSLAQILHPTARVVPARGKEMVLLSREHFTTQEQRRLVLVVDCDGQSNSAWFEDGMVIVSESRDMDADLILILGAFERVLTDYVIGRFDSPSEAEAEVAFWRIFASATTANFGIVLDAARALGKPIKIADPVSELRRRIGVRDLDETQWWIAKRSIPSIQTMARSLATKIGWSDQTLEAVVELAVDGGAKRCRHHSIGDCVSCKTRRFSNGHDIVDLVATIASFEGGFQVTSGEIARAFRIGYQGERAPVWEVHKRLAARQETIGLPLVTP